MVKGYADMLLVPHAIKLAKFFKCGPQQNRTMQFSLEGTNCIFQTRRKELVVTDGEQVVCVPEEQDIHLLAPCRHEEAYIRIML